MMDENHVAKVAKARQRVETWSSTLLFDLSEAGDGSHIINILRFVSTATPKPPSASDAEPPPPFPARYAPTKEGMELL